MGFGFGMTGRIGKDPMGLIGSANVSELLDLRTIAVFKHGNGQATISYA
jgi:hypothetical protein